MYQAILLCICLISSTVTWGQSPPLNVTFINPGFADRGFWKEVTDTMKAAAKQLNISLTVYYGDREWAKMVSAAEKVITQPNKPDYLILVNEYQQGARLLKFANQAKIPTLMLLNSLTQQQQSKYGAPREKLEYWLGSIIPDNQSAGYEMAESLISAAKKLHLDEDGFIDLLTLAGDFKTPASLFRLEGLDHALKQSEVLREQRRLTVNWSFQEAYKRTQLWLKKGRVLEAVWAANDAIAEGAIKAIVEAGLKPGVDVVIAGLNWSSEGLSLVEKHQMTLTHGGHFLAGAWSMIILRDYANGKDFAKKSAIVRFPMTAITKENIMRYRLSLGDKNWSNIDFNRFTLNDKVNAKNYQFTLNKLLQSVQ